MKILILANKDTGLYKFRKELIQDFLGDNEVVISLPYGKLVEPLKEMGCIFIDTPIDRRGINPITDFKLFLSYFRILKFEKPDLVVTYTIKPNVYGGIACRLLKIPYAVNITGLGTAFDKGGFLKSCAKILNKVACKRARVVFFENEENRQFFVSEGIVDEKYTHRLNGAGVNLDEFCVSEYSENEKITFLFMGRVMAEKGVNELFSAMKRLIDEKVNCELVVLGNYEENYEDVINLYQNEGWLKYYGYQEDVRPYIEGCHCFVLPSWHEGMANTNLESAAQARPIITSNIPGCREAVIDGETGYLVNKKDPEDLYRKMKTFVGLSYDERKNMGLKGRKHIEEVFDKKKVISETNACLF